MIDHATLLLYLPAMLAITLAPGADVLFVVASALRSGSRAGVVGALGVVAGGFVHIGFATVGLSALIVSSALAFAVLKYAGAAYLIYLGIRALLARDAEAAAIGPQSSEVPLSTVFVQGFVNNVLNPKVAIFVLAFLPQFVSASRGPVWSQMLELGAIWYATGLVYLVAIGAVVGHVRRFGSPSRRVQAGFRYVVATIFVGLGVRIALPESR